MGPKREARLPSNSSRIEFASAADDDQKSASRRFRIQKPCLTRAGFALGLSLATVVVIVVSMTVLSREKSKESPFSKEKECSFSEEAKRVGLDKFLDKLRDEFQKNHPSFIAQKPGVTSGEVREIYRPYDFRPEAIKNATDTGAALFKELQSTVLAQVDEGKLKLRERKAIHVARAVLKIAFGWSPLEGNYYLGDWLLGPNIFCWQPICDALTQLGAALPHFKPSNFNDLQNLFRVLELHRSSTYQYRENLKLAVKIGMVRPKEACKAGVREFKMRFLAITLPNETGIMGTQAARTLLSKEYLQRLKPETRETWIRQRNETVEQSLRHATIEFLWKPLIDLLRYLETDYIHHCAPSNVSSGLSSLPHPFVYASGQVLTDQPTTQKLPSGERLNGRDTYQKLVSAFTTLDLSPRELRDTAQRKLNALLSQIVTLAKQYTSERNATKAILDFRATLSSREMFYNQKPFPKNESGERAFRECATEWGARTFCPARWKAMLAWIKATYQAMDYLRPEMSRRFYTSGPKRTIPDCRITVAPWFHADAVYHSYGETKSATCSINSALQLLPFFIDDFGPRFTEWTTTAHEQLPGHHLEVRSYIENFRSNCADAVSWLSRPNYFAGFTEGWATYAEFPLMSNDTDIYSNLNNKETLLQKYGVLRYQIYAALRSLADVEINYYGTSRDEVMRLYDKYAWVTSDLASKDVTRIQSCPGIVTSYMTGQMTFLKARDVMEKSLGSSFSLPEFHYEVLRQGEIPLDYLIKYIKDISKR